MDIKKNVKTKVKPVHERALNSRFITGLHLALLFDGFSYEFTWHGIKYTGDLVKEGIQVLIIFGDWNGNEFDNSFVEIQINHRTLNIEKVNRFHWDYYRDFILRSDYEKYLDLYPPEDEKEPPENDWGILG